MPDTTRLYTKQEDTYIATTNNEEEWHTIELEETRHGGADWGSTKTRNGTERNERNERNSRFSSPRRRYDRFLSICSTAQAVP